MAVSKMKRYVTVVWTFIETLLFAGLIYGWGSLVFILKDENVYADLCDTNNSSISNLSELNNSVGRCPEQDSMLNLVFTIATTIFCTSVAITGHINYKLGTRATRIISFLISPFKKFYGRHQDILDKYGSFIFELGALMIAFASSDIPELIFPGLALIGVGGFPIMVTNIQVGHLFQSGGSIVIGFISGAFDGSSGVLNLVKLAHENGFSRRNSYLVLAGLHSLVLVSTFLFLPKRFIPKHETISIEVKQKNAEKQLDNLKSISKEMSKSPDEDEEKAHLPSLRSCLLSSSYLLHVMWVSILQLRFYFYISSLNSWMGNILEGDIEQLSYFTNVSTYMLIGGLIASPLVGLGYDFCKRTFRDSHSDLRKILLPAVPPLISGSLLGVLLCILILVPSKPVLYLIFITVTIYRSVLYSMAVVFLDTMFPTEYFGIMYGLMMFTAGIFGFLQYAFFNWAETSGYITVNIFFLCFMFISFIHPLFQWWKCSKAESDATLKAKSST